MFLHAGVTWSPDGRVMLTNRKVNEQGADVFVLDLDGSGRRELTTEGRNWYPRWSPDGRWLVYTAAVGAGDEDLDLMALPLDGSGPPVTLVGGPGREAEGPWCLVAR